MGHAGVDPVAEFRSGRTLDETAAPLENVGYLPQHDLLGRSGECMPALCAADTSDEASRGKRCQQVFQILAGNLLAGHYLPATNRPVFIV